VAREDEFKALRHFISEAKKKGGSAVIMEPVILAAEKGGGAFGPRGGGFMSSTAWVFKAKVVVYE
jgi:hypothetical protein